MHESFPLRFGDLFQEDDEGLHAGCGEPGGLRFPAAGRERRAHRFRVCTASAVNFTTRAVR